MRLEVRRPGLLSTVQDGGRWGYQGKGVPVAGAMDLPALRRGNLVAGNEPEEAALEITVLGPTLGVLEGEGIVAVAGADLGFALNGAPAPLLTAVRVRPGDEISFAGPRGGGCRGYLCFAGGVAVPPVMGSRSTFLRGALGGFHGRALRAGDVLETGDLPPLAFAGEGFSCPPDLDLDRSADRPLRVVLGPQEEAFTAEGLAIFFSSAYRVTDEADRMGYRLEGPTVAHSRGADIVSDAVPLGAIQIPGHGRPICMLADRQTTGGYQKIAVLCSDDVGTLAQRMAGDTVRFVAVTFAEALRWAKEEGDALENLRRARSTWRSMPRFPAGWDASGRWTLTVGERAYAVTWRARG